MLFVLPVLAVGIALVNYSGFPVISCPEGVVSIEAVNSLSPEMGAVCRLLLVLAIAYLMFFVNAVYKFLPQTSALPSVLYVVMTSGFLLAAGCPGFLIATLLVLIGFAGLQGAICNSQTNSPVFNFSFFISLAVLFYPKLVLLLVWCICVLFFSGRSTLKDIVALLLGIFTSLFLVLFYYYWNDDLAAFFPSLKLHILSGTYFWPLFRQETVRFAIWAFLLLLSLYRVITYYSLSVVNQRRGISAVMSLLFFLTLTVIIIPGIDFGFIYLWVLPLGYLYGEYFMIQRSRYWGDLLFILLLVSCFV